MAGSGTTAPVDHVLALLESICTSPEHVPASLAGMSKEELQAKLGFGTEEIDLNKLIAQLSKLGEGDGNEK